MTWTAPAVERAEPDRTSDERAALEQWLDFHRLTLLSKCTGLTGEQLATRSVPPSRLSLLGLVRHMTEVERWWFRIHAAGEELSDVYCSKEAPEADFEQLDAARAAEDLETFRQEVEAARTTAAGRSLEDVVASRGDHPERFRNLRWIYLHMIEEYARHNGHGDLLREAIDGEVGD